MQRLFSPQTITLFLFVAFVGAGGVALAAATMVMGALIVSAADGDAGPLSVIAAGALTGVLTAMIVHQVGMVAPRVARELWRRRRSF